MQQVERVDRDACADGGGELLPQATRKGSHAVNALPRPKNLAHGKAAAPAAQRNRILNDTPPRSVLLAIDDDSRICPVVAGSAVLDGSLLIVRTAQRDIEIRAPSSLLREAISRFDGTHSIAEALAAVLNPQRHDELRAFVAFLPPACIRCGTDDGGRHVFRTEGQPELS